VILAGRRLSLAWPAQANADPAQPHPERRCHRHRPPPRHLRHHPRVPRL